MATAKEKGFIIPINSIGIIPCQLTELIKDDIEACQKLSDKIQENERKITSNNAINPQLKNELKKINQEMRESRASHQQNVLKCLGSLNYINLPRKNWDAYNE
jgi:polyhydroxyalkanoate synthesis regulator protein